MKILLNNNQHMQIKRRLEESSKFGSGIIRELENGYYLKLDQNWQMVSVYYKKHLEYTSEQVFRLWGDIVYNVFTEERGGWRQVEKPSTTKKNLLEKVRASPRWELVPPKLQEFFINLVKNTPSNVIYRGDVLDKILAHKDSIPSEIVGEAHFYILKGNQIRKNPNMTFDLDPHQEYLQGAQHTTSVKVNIFYEGRGIATMMYKFAEEITGKKIVPSLTLSAGGSGLHKKLGNIK